MPGNPRAEAVALLDERYDARVLEPSPPAVTGAPWFADDPVGRDEPSDGRPRVSPVAGADLRWEELIERDPRLALWCSERWLASYKRLPPVAERLVETRLALHRLAEHVISPARAQANGKIGLRFTRGGFGTPFYGEEAQLRVRGDELTLQSGESERTAKITTLVEMAELAGVHLSPDMELPDEQLHIDANASALLGDWYGLGASVLEELRASAADSLSPSRVQLWPEHFDLAVEIGDEQSGQRAGYGFSPGDELHPEPYVYVAPWSEQAPGELWQSSAFKGAELGYAALHSASDQRQAVLHFLQVRLRALTGAHLAK